MEIVDLPFRRTPSGTPLRPASNKSRDGVMLAMLRDLPWSGASVCPAAFPDMLTHPEASSTFT